MMWFGMRHENETLFSDITSNEGNTEITSLARGIDVDGASGMT